MKEVVKARYPGVSVLSYQELMMPVDIVARGRLSLRAYPRVAAHCL